jgi:hypothetical protein
MNKPSTMTSGTITPGRSRIARNAPEHAAKAAENKAKVDTLNEARGTVEASIVSILTGGNPEQAIEGAVKAAKAVKAPSKGKPVPADAPGMVTVPAHMMGQPAAGLVCSEDGHGLLRVHKATCTHLPRTTRPVDSLPAKVFASYCCKPTVAPGYDRKTGEALPAKSERAGKAGKPAAAERVATYQASKKAAADAKAAKSEGQPEKVAEARRTRKAPSAGNPPVPASA